ncbi:hypothetical protein Glove_431g12 [Diversispora epigaea]|uniref:Uncharacterized protein n=1 Tax=Diversispora epigaea TaxID=1348612 RepID=A0A397GSP2_9GLOM|nr:hypothetical protein Glove_431g12 [Diversispora epigaea]
MPVNSPKFSQVPPRAYERYNRRMLKKVNQMDYNRFHSTKGRAYTAFITIFSAVTGAYLALYSDFGEEEHCFTSVRTWYANKKEEFWSLSEKEKRDLEEQGKL